MTVHGNPIELSVLLVLHSIEMSARAAMADIAECEKGFFQLLSDRCELLLAHVPTFESPNQLLVMQSVDSMPHDPVALACDILQPRSVNLQQAAARRARPWVLL